MSAQDLLVKDYMVSAPPCLRSDRTLEEAQKFFVENSLTAAPVLNPVGHIMGVLTDLGLLNCFLKRALETPKNIFLGNYIGDLEKVSTVGPEDSLVEAFKLMLKSPSRKVFVFEDKKIIGRLEPGDLFQLMSSKTGSRQFKGDIDIVKKVKLPRSAPLEAAVFNSNLFREAPAPMFACNMKGVIVAANKMIHQLLDYNDGELLGYTIRELYPITVHKDIFAEIDVISKTRRISWFPTSWVRKDTELVKVEALARLLLDNEGAPNVIIHLGVLEDRQGMNDLLLAIK